MYVLIKSRMASMEELKTCYTLDEVGVDIDKGRADELERRSKG